MFTIYILDVAMIYLKWNFIIDNYINCYESFKMYEQGMWNQEPITKIRIKETKKTINEELRNSEF